MRGPDCLATLALSAFTVTTLSADEWPQWRGPFRDGTTKEFASLQRLSPEDIKPRWRQPLGGGYSGIAVSTGRVYTLDYRKEPAEQERVLCLDAANGKTLWAHEYPVAYGRLDYGNGPRTTPTVHGKHVYTYGALGQLHCLDAQTGKPIWSREAVKDFKGRVPTWGMSCSPLVDGERILVQVGGKPDACLVALDRHTGKEVWRSLPDRPGYSSPMFIDTKTGRQLVCWTAEHVAGLDPATGRALWQVPHTTNYDVTIIDPVYHDGILLVSDYWEGTRVIQLDDEGRNPRVVWKGRQLSLLMSTPLFRDGHVYALDRHNGLKCIELRTGKVKWDAVHITPRGRNPQASLVWSGKRALILNELGELILASLTPEGCRQLGKAAVIDGTWAHPAYADGCVFVRNDKEIVCVGLRTK